MSMKKLLLAAVTAAGLSASVQAQASLLWNWTESGPGIAAAGTFTTTTTADSNGYVLITGITGTYNGSAITGLWPTGSWIPGNAPFSLDNLFKPMPRPYPATGPGPFTNNGAGFSIANGNHENWFYGNDNVATISDYLTVGPFLLNDGFKGTELQVTFDATLPEPGALSVLLIGFAGLAAAGRKRRAATPA